MSPLRYPTQRTQRRTAQRSQQSRAAKWPTAPIGVLVCVLIFCGTATAADAGSSVERCPLLAQAALNKLPPPSAPLVSSDGKSCLVGASMLDMGGVDIFDLRERDRYNEFHVPRAQLATVTELITRPVPGSRTAVIYDSGRFRSDALLLCDRLRHTGFQQVHVVNGGIAAWAQLHTASEATTLSRLSDSDVAAALAEPGSRVEAMAESLRAVLPPKSGLAAAKIDRVIVLTTASTPDMVLRSHLKKGVTTFYWAGTPERLRHLLNTQLAQDNKRLAGPAVSNTCSAL